MTFKVIDKLTGREPTPSVLTNIAKGQNLMYMDIDEFYVGEDGRLVLVDDCGKMGSVSTERFEVVPDGYGKVIRCKDCKYFEYDCVAKVDGIPLIVGHEMCNKWGDGCKTSENGFCFLAEKREVEE